MLVAGVVARVDLEPPWNVELTAVHTAATRAVGVPVYVADVAFGVDEIAGSVIFATATLDGELLVIVRLEENARGRLVGQLLGFKPDLFCFSPRWLMSQQLAMLTLVGARLARVPPIRVLEAS